MKRPLRFLLSVLTGVLAFGISHAWRRFMVVEPSISIAAEPALKVERKAVDSGEWTRALIERDPVKRLEGLTNLLAKSPASGWEKRALDHVDDPDALALILRRAAESDPRAAAGWVLGQVRDGRMQIWSIGPVMEVWADSDPMAMAGWLKEPANSLARYSQLEKLTNVLFSRDQAAALALARDFPAEWKLPEAAKAWIKADPETATKACAGLGTGKSYEIDATGEALVAWMKKDPLAAVDWTAKQVGKDTVAGQFLLAKGLEAWAASDPVAAAAYFTTLPPGSVPAHGLVKAWAAKDPESALRWAEQANVPKRADMIAEAIKAVVETDINKASALVSGMEDGILRDKATASLTMAWAKKDPLAALTWASELPGGPARNNSIADAASTWAGNDVKAAAEWAKNAPAGSLPPAAYSRIMWTLGRDVSAAYTWVNELPEGAANHVVDSMFSLPREPEASAALALPDGKYKARMVEKVASNFFVRSPDQALAWALALPEAGQRAQMRGVVEGMEPVEQFSSWNGMTKEKKAEILERLK